MAVQRRALNVTIRDGACASDRPIDPAVHEAMLRIGRSIGTAGTTFAGLGIAARSADVEVRRFQQAFVEGLAPGFERLRELGILLNDARLGRRRLRALRLSPRVERRAERRRLARMLREHRRIGSW